MMPAISNPAVEISASVAIRIGEQERQLVGRIPILIELHPIAEVFHAVLLEQSNRVFAKAFVQSFHFARSGVVSP